MAKKNKQKNPGVTPNPSQEGYTAHLNDNKHKPKPSPGKKPGAVVTVRGIATLPSGVSLNKGGGSQAGQGLGLSKDAAGKPILGKNQTAFGGKLFNTKHFAGLVSAIGGVKRARKYLGAHPGAVTQLGMDDSSVESALGSLEARRKRLSKSKRDNDGYGGVGASY